MSPVSHTDEWVHRQVIEQVAADVSTSLPWRKRLYAASPGQRFVLERKVDVGAGSRQVSFTAEKLAAGDERVLHGKPGIRLFATDYPDIEHVIRRSFPVYLQQKRETLESFERFAQGDGLPEWPTEIFLELSNICDLKCAMCPTFSALNPRRFINLRNTDRGLLAVEDGTRPLEELLKHALVVHTFGYGEPTIHPQFREFIDYISQYEVMIDFFSHGMHLTEDLCVFLVERGINCITISFSGADKESYENVYLGGDFDRVLAGITCLAETKKRLGSSFPQIHVNSIGFRHHVDKLDKFAELMGSAGVNRINLKPLATYDNMPELHTHVSVLRDSVEGAVIERAKVVASKYNMEIDSRAFEMIRVDDDADVMEFLNSRHKGGAQLASQPVDIAELKVISREKKPVREDDGQMGEKKKERLQRAKEHFMPINRSAPCFEPFKTLYASFNGDVYPCCFKQSQAQPLGSLKSQDGTDIWQSGDFLSLREEAIQNRYRSDICASCIRAGAFPKKHTVDMKAGRYARWLSLNYQVNMDGKFVERICRLPDNKTIFANQQRAREQLARLRECFAASGIAGPVNMSSGLSLLLDRHARHSVLQAFERHTPGHLQQLDSALSSTQRQRHLKASGITALGVALCIGAANTFSQSTMLSMLELGLVVTGAPLLLFARRMPVVTLNTMGDVLAWLEKQVINAG